jgi:hypothetical protein
MFGCFDGFSPMTRAKRKTTQRGRQDGQVPTRPTTAREIMSSSGFALGAADVRAGRGYRTDYESWSDVDKQWNYERGRQWAQQAPCTVALRRNGKITDEAVRWFTTADII